MYFPGGGIELNKTHKFKYFKNKDKFMRRLYRGFDKKVLILLCQNHKSPFDNRVTSSCQNYIEPWEKRDSK